MSLLLPQDQVQWQGWLVFPTKLPPVRFSQGKNPEYWRSFSQNLLYEASGSKWSKELSTKDAIACHPDHPPGQFIHYSSW